MGVVGGGLLPSSTLPFRFAQCVFGQRIVVGDQVSVFIWV